MMIKLQWLTAVLLLATISLRLRADAPAPTLDQLLDIAPKHSPVQPKNLPTNTQDDTAVPVENKSMKAVIQQMHTAANRLDNHRDSGLATQRLQKTILDRIDQMIKTAQQSPPSGKPDGSPENKPGGSGQGNAQQGQNQKAAGQSQTASQGSASAAPVQDHESGQPIRQHRVEWGSLPPRLRDELLEGSAERFSPVYRALTEQYYKRLAEQQP